MKTILILILAACTASAQITEPQAVRAILGESLGQPFRAQVLIGAVLRARGSLDGVYGVSNPIISTADKRAKETARRAWRASVGLRTKARYFGCQKDEAYFERCGFRRVNRIGSIVFYIDPKNK